LLLFMSHALKHIKGGQKSQYGQAAFRCSNQGRPSPSSVER
jgi:hypothetical protein